MFIMGHTNFIKKAKLTQYFNKSYAVYAFLLTIYIFPNSDEATIASLAYLLSG